LDFDKDFSSDIEFIPISMQREISLAKDYKSLKKLKAQIQRIKPDVIHLHSSKAGVLGRIASKAHSVARVYYTPNGYAFLREDVSSLKKQFYRTIEWSISKMFGGITIACGDTEFDYAKEIGIAVLVRNGIDLDVLKDIQQKNSQKLNSIVTLGRISAQKNPGLFNDIAKVFPQLRFIWIGDGELKHLLTAENIIVTGWLNREEALSLLASHDVYIQTSLWEGLPFTIIEAMALQKPIIATNVIGNKDAVEHHENGFLCDTIEDFEKAIQELLGNPSLLHQLAKESKAIAHKKFDRDKNFQKLLKIYLS
jgi:hypothetical protein